MVAVDRVETERVGAVNRLYGFAHRVGERKKAWKRRHPVGYRVARYALILGDDEVASGEWTVKKLADGSQEKIRETELVGILKMRVEK